MTSGNGEFYVKAVRLPSVFVRSGWKAVCGIRDTLNIRQNTTCRLSNIGHTLHIDNATLSAKTFYPICCLH